MPTLILLPGMDGSTTLLQDFAAEFTQQPLLLFYPTQQPLGYRELEEWVLAKLPQDGPFVLVAESFSGPIAIALAARQLPQLRGVVLVCTFAKAPYWIPAFLHPLIATIPFWWAPMGLVARRLLGRFRTPAGVAKLAQAVRGVAPSVWRVRLRAVLGADLTPLLKLITVPILYLQASEDGVVPPAAAATILRHFPRVTLQAFEAPHLLLQTKPRESAAAVRAFARELGIEL